MSTSDPAIKKIAAKVPVDLVKEKAEILRRYRGLLRAIPGERSAEDSRLIRKAFNIAVEAHKDQRRKTGEPTSTIPLP